MLFDKFYSCDKVYCFSLNFEVLVIFLLYFIGGCFYIVMGDSEDDIAGGEQEVDVEALLADEAAIRIPVTMFCMLFLVLMLKWIGFLVTASNK